MHEFIIEAIARGGYLGIFLLMAIENVFPPIPSEVIMGIGGLLVGRGTMEFWPLLAAGTLGSTAGNYVWFWIGDKWGYRRLAPIVDRHGRWLTLEWQDNRERPAVLPAAWAVGGVVPAFLALPAHDDLASRGPVAHEAVEVPAVHFRGRGHLERAADHGRPVARPLFRGSQGVMAWIVLGALGLALLAYVWRVFTWKPRSERS